MNDDYDLEEVPYSEEEETEVIKEIRLGLMLNEISREVTRRELLDWFAPIQIKKLNWCDNVTCKDLFNIASACGMKIIK